MLRVNVSDFDFALPPEAIAQRPAPRGTARLMTLDRATGATRHRAIADLPTRLRAGDLLVVNDTKVIPARLFGTDEKGRRTEFLLVERVRGDRGEEPGDSSNGPELWRCLAKPGRRVKAGKKFFFESGWTAEPALRLGETGATGTAGTSPAAEPEEHSPSKKSALSGRSEAGLYVLRFTKHGSRENLLDALYSIGSAPLPPYIHRPGGVADTRDAADYQTVFAEHSGAIAAPTAGLHFTPELLARIEAQGVLLARVTLHVGLGTFKPVKVARAEDHVMEKERGTIPDATVEAIARAKAEGRRVVAVGTTTVRTLETSARVHAGRVAPGPFETSLFLRPGAPFHVVDALLTNFHLPRSTLLMLVAAFAGRENVLAAYREAVTAGYRFFSYGDAMFIA